MTTKPRALENLDKATQLKANFADESNQSGLHNKGDELDDNIESEFWAWFEGATDEERYQVFIKCVRENTDRFFETRLIQER